MRRLFLVSWKKTCIDYLSFLSEIAKISNDRFGLNSANGLN